MLRCIAVGGLLLCACSFNSGGFTRSDDDEADAAVVPGADADVNAPDADPNAPDADPSAPDAAVAPIDAAVPPPDAPPPPIDAAPVLRTVVFRDGLGGYSGTRDTTIREAEPLGLHGSDPVIGWDTVSGASPSGEDYGLLKFEGITGIGGDAIPTGATIVSATLSLMVTDPGGEPGGELHEVAVDWSELTTWDSFGVFPGVQAEEVGDFVGTLPMSTGAANLDVTSAVAEWVTDPLGISNRGWIFVPASSNGVEVGSREASEPANRPTLTVEYFDP